MPAVATTNRVRFDADFVGQGVLLRGVAIGRSRVVREFGELAGDNPLSMEEGAAVDLLLRPRRIDWRSALTVGQFAL